MPEERSNELPVITCVLVFHADGERVWEPLQDYLQNPKAGTFIVRENRRRDWLAEAA